MSFLETLSRRHTEGKKLPAFRPGDKVRVNYKIVEGEKERIQPFEGTCIVLKKGRNNSSFTVRKMSAGVGVERTFPMYSPLIDSIDLISKGRVRQGRLFYLRDLSGRKARIESVAGGVAQDAEGLTAETAPVMAETTTAPETTKTKK